METEKKSSIIKEILGIALVFILSYVVFVGGSNYVFLSIRVVGNSMYPTLHDTDRGVSNRLVNEGNIDYADVVVVKGKDEKKEFWVKRVIGLPNDRVCAKDDVVYVNDVPIDESYLDKDYVAEVRREFGVFTIDFDEVVLGEDEYFVLGDNRMYSKDSRMVGAFHADDIASKDFFIYYPFNHLGIE